MFRAINAGINPIRTAIPNISISSFSIINNKTKQIIIGGILIKEFLEAMLRGYCSPYSVIPACRESFRSIGYAQQYSKAKKDSGQAGMTSLIPRPESLRDCGVVYSMPTILFVKGIF